MNIDIRTKDAAYVEIKQDDGSVWVIYIDDSTGEKIIESWVNNEDGSKTQLISCEQTGEL
jgi:hypothetical protein|tara:strand:+ start:438 stop:617 length:180 start_codon:yes stop_codon:yes gene_type:complete